MITWLIIGELVAYMTLCFMADRNEHLDDNVWSYVMTCVVVLAWPFFLAIAILGFINGKMDR